MTWTGAAAPTGPAWTLGGFASSTSTYSTPDTPVRTAQGLLAWSLASSENDGSIASRTSFATAPWKAQGKSPTNVALNLNGSLSYSGPLFNLLNAILNTSVDSRVTFLVQARCLGVASQGDLVSVGPAVRCEPTGITGTSTVSAIRHTHPASASTLNLGIEEIRNDTSARASLISAISPSGTTQRSAVWSNGTQAASYDFALGVTSSITLSAQNVLARPGLVFHDATGGSAGQLLCPEWIACTDRFVTVSGAGLTAGVTVKVERSDGSVMASAAASGSAATLDMLAVTLDGAHTRLAVYDSGNSLLSVLTVATPGIWPGDVYTVGASVATAIVGVVSAWTPSAAPSATWTPAAAP